MVGFQLQGSSRESVLIMKVIKKTNFFHWYECSAKIAWFSLCNQTLQMRV